MKTAITLKNGQTIDIADEMFELIQIRDGYENYLCPAATQRMKAVGDRLSSKGGPEMTGLVLLETVNSHDFPEEFSSHLAVLWNAEDR